MLWVLKRTVSVRQFFWAPKTYMFKLMDKKLTILLSIFSVIYTHESIYQDFS